MQAKNMSQFNEQEERHGYWKIHRTDGSLFYISNYVNGLEYGLDIIYVTDGSVKKFYYAR